jgi:hypothetical protein
MELIAANEPGRIELARTMYPMRLAVLAKGERVGAETSTIYGYVSRGTAAVRCAPIRLAELAEGAWFALPGPVEVSMDLDARVVVIERCGFRAIPLVGALEERGRLAYIDGCSDSILASPPRLGDPVLNHLHFPRETRQTLHRHPSMRLGVVARGRGKAIVGTSEHALEAGTAFAIDAHELHAFATSASSMDVVAFHPDSDWGPTDGAHPMLNRTYLKRDST